jgi:hypothetical protein
LTIYRTTRPLTRVSIDNVQYEVKNGVFTVEQPSPALHKMITTVLCFPEVHDAPAAEQKAPWSPDEEAERATKKPLVAAIRAAGEEIEGRWPLEAVQRRYDSLVAEGKITPPEAEAAPVESTDAEPKTRARKPLKLA